MVHWLGSRKVLIGTRYSQRTPHSYAGGRFFRHTFGGGCFDGKSAAIRSSSPIEPILQAATTTTMKRKRSRKALQAIPVNQLVPAELQPEQRHGHPRDEQKEDPALPPSSPVSKSSTTTTSIPLLDDSEAAFLTTTASSSNNNTAKRRGNARAKTIAKTSTTTENHGRSSQQQPTTSSFGMMPFTSTSKTPKMSNVTVNPDTGELKAVQMSELGSATTKKDNVPPYNSNPASAQQTEQSIPPKTRDEAVAKNVTTTAKAAVAKKTSLSNASDEHKESVDSPLHAKEPQETTTNDQVPKASSVALPSPRNGDASSNTTRAKPARYLSHHTDDTRLFPPAKSKERDKDGVNGQAIPLETCTLPTDMESATAAMDAVPSLNVITASVTNAVEDHIKTQFPSSKQGARVITAARNENSNLLQNPALAHERAMTLNLAKNSKAQKIEPTGERRPSSHIQGLETSNKEETTSSTKPPNKKNSTTNGENDKPSPSKGLSTPAPHPEHPNIRPQLPSPQRSKTEPKRRSSEKRSLCNKKQNVPAKSEGAGRPSSVCYTMENANIRPPDSEHDAQRGTAEDPDSMNNILEDIVLKTPSATRASRTEPPPLIQPFIEADFVEQYRNSVPDNQDILKRMLGSLGSIQSMDQSSIFCDISSPKRTVSGMLLHVPRDSHHEEDDMSDVTFQALRKKAKTSAVKSKTSSSNTRTWKSIDAQPGFGSRPVPMRDPPEIRHEDSPPQIHSHEEQFKTPVSSSITKHPQDDTPRAENAACRIYSQAQSHAVKPAAREGKKKLQRLREKLAPSCQAVEARTPSERNKLNDTGPAEDNERSSTKDRLSGVLSSNAKTKDMSIEGENQRHAPNRRSLTHRSSQIKRDPPETIKRAKPRSVNKQQNTNPPRASSVEFTGEWFGQGVASNPENSSRKSETESAAQSAKLEAQQAVRRSSTVQTKISSSANHTQNPVRPPKHQATAVFPISCPSSAVLPRLGASLRNDEAYNQTPELLVGEPASISVPPLGSTPPSPNGRQDIRLNSISSPSKLSSLPLWTARLSGHVNVTPIICLSDGRQFRHTPLPPGWSVVISKSRKALYYRHPDMGTTFYPPVLMPSANGSIHSGIVYIQENDQSQREASGCDATNERVADVEPKSLVLSMLQSTAATPTAQTPPMTPKESFHETASQVFRSSSSTTAEPRLVKASENEGAPPEVKQSTPDSYPEEVEVARCAQRRDMHKDEPVLLKDAYVDQMQKEGEQKHSHFLETSHDIDDPVVWNDTDSPLPCDVEEGKQSGTLRTNTVDDSISRVDRFSSQPPDFANDCNDETKSSKTIQETEGNENPVSPYTTAHNEDVCGSTESNHFTMEPEQELSLQRRKDVRSTTPTTAYLSSRASSTTSARALRVRSQERMSQIDMYTTTPTTAFLSSRTAASSVRPMRIGLTHSDNERYDGILAALVHSGRPAEIESCHEHVHFDAAGMANGNDAGDLPLGGETDGGEEVSESGRGSALSSLASRWSLLSLRVRQPTKPLCCLQNIGGLALASSTKRSRAATKKKRKAKKTQNHEQCYSIPRSILAVGVGRGGKC